MAAKRKAAPASGFQPFMLRDPASVIGGKFGTLYALAPTFCGVRVVERVCNIESQLGVRDRIVNDWQLPNYPRLTPEEFPLQSSIASLKEEMLLHGATPEAVQLVGAVSPFSEKELKIMAEKLKSKTAAKKAPAKKDAAPKAAKPAAKPAPKTKADEAATGKRAELMGKKIKVVNKDHGARAGSNRAVGLDTVIKAKTVADAVSNGAAMVDVRYAEKMGYIELV